MSLKAGDKQQAGAQFEAIEVGTYPARLVGVVDLGLQPQNPYQGKEKAPGYMVAITYEFLDEFLKDEEGNDLEDKPRWLSEQFVLFGLEAERAKSTKRITALDPDNLHEGDLCAMLGTPVMVTVTHNESKGKTYANVGAISPMREKDAAKAPELVGSTFAFDLDEPDLDVFNALPEFIKKKVTSNLEFEGSDFAALIGNQPAKAAEPEGDAAEEDDGNPY
jgi:hypothetical protein